MENIYTPTQHIRNNTSRYKNSILGLYVRATLYRPQGNLKSVFFLILLVTRIVIVFNYLCFTLTYYIYILKQKWALIHVSSPSPFLSLSRKLISMHGMFIWHCGVARGDANFAHSLGQLWICWASNFHVTSRWHEWKWGCLSYKLLGNWRFFLNIWMLKWWTWCLAYKFGMGWHS